MLLLLSKQTVFWLRTSSNVSYVVMHANLVVFSSKISEMTLRPNLLSLSLAAYSVNWMI